MSRDRTAERTTLLAALARHPVLVVAAAIAAGFLGAGIGLWLPLSYDATAHVVVSLPDQIAGSDEGGELPVEAAQRAAEAMVGEAVTRAAGERLPGRPGPEAVAAAISVVPSPDSGLVSITATDSTPGGARALADAVGESYLEVSAAETADRYARRIERLESERTDLQTQLATVWDAFGRRAAALRADAGPSTISVVIGSDPVLQQLREDGGRIAERLSTVERSIVDAEASTALAPLERQELVRADDPPSERAAMVRRSVGVAVPLGVLLGAGLAWRRVEREGTTSAQSAHGFRFLGRLPAAHPRPPQKAVARTSALWRQLRVMAQARGLEDLVVLELPSSRSGRASEQLLAAARADGCVVRHDADGPRRRERAARNGSRSAGVGPLRVVRATSTAVLSSVPVPGHAGVVVLGSPSASFDRDVRAVAASVTAAGADFLGVLVVDRAARGRGLFRLPVSHAAAGSAPVTTAGRRGGAGVR